MSQKTMKMLKMKNKTGSKTVRKAVEKIVHDRKLRAIKPDNDPLAWAKIVCGYPAANAEQSDAVANIRNAAIVLVVSIIQNCKASTDRTTAIRKVREAMMFATSAVVLDWEEL